jgi:hypothetical protein
MKPSSDNLLITSLMWNLVIPLRICYQVAAADDKELLASLVSKPAARRWKRVCSGLDGVSEDDLPLTAFTRESDTGPTRSKKAFSS